MKSKSIIIMLFSFVLVIISCKKDEDLTSERQSLLTAHIWTADSLLADGVDESGEGGLLEVFKGDTKFNEDGSGHVGEIEGTWSFADNEEDLVISSDSLPVDVTTHIEELTETSLKLTTVYPLQTQPLVTADVRMTFIPK